MISNNCFNLRPAPSRRLPWSGDLKKKKTMKLMLYYLNRVPYFTAEITG